MLNRRSYPVDGPEESVRRFESAVAPRVVPRQQRQRDASLRAAFELALELQVGESFIGIDEEGTLVPVGRVGSGLDDVTRARLVKRLREHATDEPVVDVPRYGPEKVAWVEPAVYCEVKFLERTRDGQLRAPVFVRLLEE